MRPTLPALTSSSGKFVISAKDDGIVGKEYLVITDVSYNSKQYVYLVNKADESDSLYREVLEDNNGFYLQEIDKTLFGEKILDLFMEELRKE